MIEDKPLRQIIEEILPGNVICMTDFPQYNAEFVGNVLAKLVEEGLILSWDTASREQVNETSTLEFGKDRLVYQLYGLTEEEFRIVEGKE